MSPGEIHRYDGDLLHRQEGNVTPSNARRVALAIGPEPVPDARHLLPPLNLPPPPSPLPAGPFPPTEFIIDVTGDGDVSMSAVRSAFSVERRGKLGLVSVWVRQPARGNLWFSLENVHNEGRVNAIAASREMTDFLMDAPGIARELTDMTRQIGQFCAPLGWTPVSREEPANAARRAVALNNLRLRYSRSVEMRLLPRGRAFPSRDVWRTAYSLGLVWGDMDLFHWHNPDDPRRLFTLHSVSPPGYFLPERAVEGEGVAGIALSFELPHNPAPGATYDRMALALSHFRQQLGGQTVTVDGSELDADRLWQDKDTLTMDVEDMSTAGFPPSSAAVERLF